MVQNFPDSSLTQLNSIAGSIFNKFVDTLVAIKRALPVNSVPECEQWRLGLLTSLLRMRADKELSVEDPRIVQGQIDSLCST